VKGYLFDTDSISEIWRKRPVRRYLDWLTEVGRDEQYTSAVVVGELFKGAYRSSRREHFLKVIEDEVLPRFTVLAYDVDVARVYGQTRAELESMGVTVAEADLQIASTGLRYGLTVVTGNVRHFEKVPRLTLRDLRA
jgi:tRNA(fMet)-specific endonuclease VapC